VAQPNRLNGWCADGKHGRDDGAVTPDLGCEAATIWRLEAITRRRARDRPTSTGPSNSASRSLGLNRRTFQPAWCQIRRRGDARARGSWSICLLSFLGCTAGTAWAGRRKSHRVASIKPFLHLAQLASIQWNPTDGLRRPTSAL
jgi:hypothetical protein